MYSTTSEDLSRDHLALQVTSGLKKIVENHQTVTQLHKELVEIDLSFTAYIEESKNRIQNHRLNLARQAKSSQEVVEILSEK